MNIRLVDIDLYSVVLLESRFTVVALAVLQLVVGYEIPREGELDRHAVVLTAIVRLKLTIGASLSASAQV